MSRPACLRLNIRVSLWSLYTTSMILVGLPYAVQARDWFNPAFLSKAAAGGVADLSRFESGSGQAPGIYRVDIWLNDEFIMTGNMRFDATEAAGKPAQVEGNTPELSATDDTGLLPCLSIKWLKRFGVDTFTIPELKDIHDENQCVDFMRIFPGASSHYDFPSQRLMLTFPQAAIQNSIRGYIPPEEWDQGINAGLVNYALTGSQGNGDNSYYLNLTSGLNVGVWRLRNNSAWSYYDSQNGSHKQWQNISTYAQRTVIPLRSELVLGDSNSSGELFDSLGFRGARLYSSDPMYPDSQQGYAPTIRGIASGRSKITVRQNGYVIYQSTIQSGAFEISDLNPTSSSGDLNVTLENDAGNIQKFTVPYSTVPLLQREGRMKFDLLAGRYRSGLSDKGDPLFVQGTLQKGFQHGLTIFGGTQLAQKYTSVAIGLGRNLGSWGAISTDVTSAQSELVDGSRHNGQSIRFLYSKSLNDYGTTFQLLGYRYSTRGFYTLDEVSWDTMDGYQYDKKDNHDDREPVSYHDLRRSKKGRFQLTISQQLFDIGSLNLSATHQDYWNATGNDKWYQAGFSSAWHGISYSLSYALSQSAGMPEKDRLLSLNVSIPFGRWLSHDMPEHDTLGSMYAIAQTSRDQDGVTQVQTGISGTMLEGSNLSYSLMQGHNSQTGNNGDLNVSWQGTYGKAGAGYSYGRNQHAYNWDLSGGIVAHENGLTFGQPLGDTNVLIKAPGAKGVSVENETGVSTDWRGYAVMPYATVYRRNRIALDVNSLDIHTDLEDNVQNVVPTEGAIVRAEYKAHVGVRALLTLMYRNHSVPFGTVVTEKISGATGIVSETGDVYLTGVPLKGNLDIVWGDSPSEKCQIPYILPENSEKLPVVQMILKCSDGREN